MTGNVDILMVSETKLDNSFPVGQFLIDGYATPTIVVRDIHGGGLTLVRLGFLRIVFSGGCVNLTALHISGRTNLISI